jgi:hypothetical protein
MKNTAKNLLISIIEGIICIPIGYFASEAPRFYYKMQMEEFWGDIINENSSVNILTVGHKTKDVRGVTYTTSVGTTHALSETYNLLGEIGKQTNINLSIFVSNKYIPELDVASVENLIVVGGVDAGEQKFQKYTGNILEY